MPTKLVYSYSMEPMPRSRSYHSCGLVTDFIEGPEVIVAGGYVSDYLDSVDIYSIDADSWREGNTSKHFFQNVCN